MVGCSLLLQDAVMAFRLGVGPEQDGFQGAYQIVAMLWNVVSGGTYLAVALPMLMTAEKGSSKPEALALLSDFSRKLSILMCCCVACISTALTSFSYFSTGHGWPLVVMLCSLPIHILSYHAIVVLLGAGYIFLGTASASIIPLTIVMAGLLFELTALYAAVGLLIGSIAQLAVLIAISASINQPLYARQRIPNGLSERTVALALKNMFQVGIASLLMVGVYWLVLYGGSAGIPGNISLMSFALRPASMISALATVVLVNILLARFTKRVGCNELIELRREFGRIAAVVFVATSGVVLIWSFLDTAFFIATLERGAFSRADTLSVVALNRVAMLQVPAYMVGVVAWRVLNAVARNDLVLICSALTLMCVSIAIVSSSNLTPHQALLFASYGYVLWGALLSWAALNALNLKGIVPP
jgi:peptidoglycan biosynthesis protein MviN/MurJ (putative lipid II flippase)